MPLQLFTWSLLERKCEEVTASVEAGVEVGNTMVGEVDKSAQSFSPREVNKTIEMRV